MLNETEYAALLIQRQTLKTQIDELSSRLRAIESQMALSNLESVGFYIGQHLVVTSEFQAWWEHMNPGLDVNNYFPLNVVCQVSGGDGLKIGVRYGTGGVLGCPVEIVRGMVIR